MYYYYKYALQAEELMCFSRMKGSSLKKNCYVYFTTSQNKDNINIV